MAEEKTNDTEAHLKLIATLKRMKERIEEAEEVVKGDSWAWKIKQDKSDAKKDR